MVDIVYKKTGAIFNQHTYWTKQPIESITYFIEKYTQKGEVILDPFCGSGMTGLGATLTGRKAILRDISPACIHIATGYNKKLKIDYKVLDEFIGNIKDKLIKFYVTKCNQCNKQAKIKYEIIGEKYKDKNGEIVSISEELFNSIKNNSEFDKSKGKIQDLTFLEHFVLRICYSCSCSKEKMFKVPCKNDLMDKSYLNESNKFPTDFFFGKECKRNFKKNIYQVSDLYSKKNLFALNFIREQILLVKDQSLKDFLLFNFTSILFNTSLMSRYRGYENTSIKMGTYYVPQLIKDNNVVASYVRKVLSSYNANKDIFSGTDIINVEISLGDATNLIGIEDDSIDLIYTDPPYADIINYSELNLVWESWLGVSND
jgi:16S rRNA G966 N2-methylase RsmD